MSRQVLATIRLVIPAGTAKPSPPVGPALGQVRREMLQMQTLRFTVPCQSLEAPKRAFPFLPHERPNVCPFAIPAAAWFTTLCLNGNLKARPSRNKAQTSSLLAFQFSSCVELDNSLRSNSAARKNNLSAADIAGVLRRYVDSFFWSHGMSIDDIASPITSAIGFPLTKTVCLWIVI